MRAISFLIICYACFSNRLEKCSREINRSLASPLESQTGVILGRNYISTNYGLALQIPIFDKGQYSGNKTKLNIPVHLCRTSKVASGIQKLKYSRNISEICNILLWGRLVGPEILRTQRIVATSTLIHSKDLVTSVCNWNVEFPSITVAGSYEAEVMAIWINADQDADETVRGLHAGNNGTVVHLGGIGILRNRTSEPPNTLDIRLNDGDPERAAAHVFGSPFKFSVIDSAASARPASTNSLPMCQTGNNSGRWVYETSCAIVEGNRSLSVIGQECWQTDIAYQGLGLPAPVLSRAKCMVWRPYSCRLRYFPFTPGSGRGKTRVAPESQAALCLLRSGVGVIAGFGDSLGTEQRNNLEALLGGRTWRNGSNSAAKGWLECDGWVANHHWLWDEVNLIKCVERQVRTLLRTASPLRTVVLVTNFNIHHAQWKSTMAENLRLLARQADAYSALRRRLTLQGVHLRCIWLGAVAIHGFRVPGLTPVRQQTVNAAATRILGGAGWDLLDAYALTDGRPDGTTDGVHYRGGVSKAITTVLMNMVCTDGRTVGAM